MPASPPAATPFRVLVLSTRWFLLSWLVATGLLTVLMSARTPRGMIMGAVVYNAWTWGAVCLWYGAVVYPAVLLLTALAVGRPHADSSVLAAAAGCAVASLPAALSWSTRPAPLSQSARVWVFAGATLFLARLLVSPLRPGVPASAPTRTPA